MPIINLPSITSRRLFSPDRASVARFTIGRVARSWHLVAWGYRQAADALVEHLTDRARMSEPACLPIIFLYRHYVELSLKGMLLVLGELSAKLEKPSHKHALVPLWDLLRTKLSAQVRIEDDHWMQRAGSIIREFDSMDPKSFAFRYPVDNNQVPNLESDLRVDIVQFREVMDELAIVLDGTATMIDQHLEYKRDMESQFEYYV